jgi:8-oxo-dGTP pyrophosphatase MutT (NUDIX family)
MIIALAFWGAQVVTKVKVKKPEKAKAAQSRDQQVAALPFRRIAGSLEVLIITSRETGRFIIPKGWPMKGRTDYDAAAIEAREEAGLIGKVHRKPVGTYTYWKRLADQCRLVKVDVYPLEVTGQLETWPEKQSRRMAWLSPKDAATLVDEPQLITLIGNLEELLR